MSKKTITPEMHKFFSENGKKGGKKLSEQRGPEYYRRIRKMRKTYPKRIEEPKTENATV